MNHLFALLMQGVGLIDCVRVPKRSNKKILRKVVPAASFFLGIFKLSLPDYHGISDRN